MLRLEYINIQKSQNNLFNQYSLQYISMKILITIALIFSSISLSLNHPSHHISTDVSKQTAENIKARIINALPLFKNQVMAKALQDDLNQVDDTKRSLKSVTVTQAAEVFAVFGMRIPDSCDTNNDGIVNGSELTCFNKIWQSFVIPKS